jgi:periplasmic mercuric ion binding protein
MKTTIKVFTIMLLSSFILFANSTNAQDKKVAKEAEVTFSVDITCPNCVKKLESQLPYEKGVKDLKVDLATKTVWFKYKESVTNKETLAKALEKLGYPAKEFEAKK